MWSNHSEYLLLFIQSRRGGSLTIPRGDLHRHLDPWKAQEMDNWGAKPTLREQPADNELIPAEKGAVLS